MAWYVAEKSKEQLFGEKAALADSMILLYGKTAMGCRWSAIMSVGAFAVLCNITDDFGLG